MYEQCFWWKFFVVFLNNQVILLLKRRKQKCWILHNCLKMSNWKRNFHTGAYYAPKYFLEEWRFQKSVIDGFAFNPLKMRFSTHLFSFDSFWMWLSLNFSGIMGQKYKSSIKSKIWHFFFFFFSFILYFSCREMQGEQICQIFLIYYSHNIKHFCIFRPSLCLCCTGDKHCLFNEYLYLSRVPKPSGILQNPSPILF